MALVAPEPRHCLVRRGPSGDTLGDTASLIDGVLNRFEANAASAAMVVPVSGDVTDGADVRIAGPQELVDDDAVFDRQLASCSKLDVGNHSDPDHDQVRVEDASIHRLDSADRAPFAEDSRHF